MATSSDHNLDTVLVTGGSGGLASQILQLFSQRGCTHLRSIDLRQPCYRLANVTYHEADLTDTAAMRRIYTNTKPDVVIHTASPKFDAPQDIMYKVNVEGTRTLLKLAKESGTRSFVYTSSASVISDGKMDLRDANETFPVITGDQQPEFYTHTKVSVLLALCMDKAKTRLGYKPLVGLEEGLRVAVEGCMRRRQENQNGTQKASRWVNGLMSWTRVSIPRNMTIDSSGGIGL